VQLERRKNRAIRLWTSERGAWTVDVAGASCEQGSIQTLDSRSSYTTAQDVLKSSNCRELLTTLCINIDWERGLTEWIPVVSLVCLMHSPVTATCYEQPVLGAHLGSPWLLGLLRRKLWSRSILLARCCTPLLAPTALASSTSPPTQQDRKCFPIYHFLANALQCQTLHMLRMLESGNAHATYLHPLESFSQGATARVTCKSDGDFLWMIHQSRRLATRSLFTHYRQKT